MNENTKAIITSNKKIDEWVAVRGSFNITQKNPKALATNIAP